MTKAQQRVLEAVREWHRRLPEVANGYASAERIRSCHALCRAVEELLEEERNEARDRPN